MKKLKKILKRNKIYRYALIASIILVVIITVLLIINNKSLITSDFEYWVPLSSIKEVDKENGYYIIEPKTVGYSFGYNGECKTTTFSKEYDEEGHYIYEGNYFYNPSLFLNAFNPSGGWVSEESMKCNYKNKSDSLVINVDTSTSSYTMIGTYNFVDKDTLLITWGNSDISNQIYKKITSYNYIEPFYYFEEKVSDKDVYFRTIKKIKVDDIKNMIMVSKDILYFSDNMLAAYIKEKYNMDFDDADFIYLNRNKCITYSYMGELGTYSAYNITDDGYLELYVPKKKRTEEEIIKILEERYETVYGKKKKVKLKKLSLYTYGSFIRFDMLKDDEYFDNFIINGLTKKNVYNNSY